MIKCLICAEDTCPREIGEILGGFCEYGKACIKLKGQLSVIFLLRKVLGISPAYLESLLRNHGDPTNWGVTLCTPCNRVLIEAEFIYERLLKLSGEFNELVGNLRKHLKEKGDTTVLSDGLNQRRKRGKKKRKNGMVKSSTSTDLQNKSLCPSELIRCEFLKGLAEKSSARQISAEFPIETLSEGHEHVSLRNVKVEVVDCGNENLLNSSEPATADDDVSKGRITRTLSKELQVDDLDSEDAGNDDLEDNDDGYIPSPNSNDDDDDRDYESDNSKREIAVDVPEPETDKSEVDPFSGPQPVKVGMGHYKCPICGRKAITKCSSHGHILRAHYNASKPFHCHLCRDRFKRDVYLRQHLEDVHNGSSTPLDDPEELQIEKSSEFSLPNPPNRITKRTFKCDLCPAKMKYKVLYGSQETLEAHKKLVHFGIKKPYNCKLCSKSFKIHSMLRHHMYVHRRHEKEKKVTIKEQPFCHECNRSFKNIATLKAHCRVTKRHLQPLEYPFQCELCPKGYYQRQSLDNHHAQEHFEQLDLQPFKCSFCGSVLSSQRALDHHVRIRHTKDTLYRCEPCDLGFMFNHSYKRHMSVVHAKEKPLLCSYCPKRFASKNHLETHVRVHTGEKPFKCPHCDKKYSDRPTYRRHLETHGEQEYKCSICEVKPFKIWHSYRTHMKTHNQDVYKKPPNVIPSQIGADATTVQHFANDFSIVPKNDNGDSDSAEVV